MKLARQMLLFCPVFILFMSLFQNHCHGMEPEQAKGQQSRKPSFVPTERPFSVLVIEEGENSLGIYDSDTRQETGRIHLNFFPHEIEVSPDGATAYVSNFGIRDYDMKVGHPGNCISVIDLKTLCEVNRLYTTFEGKNYWGPHGLKLHPNGKELYVNVECVNGRYPSSNSPQESKMFVFNLENNEVERLLPRPSGNLPQQAYSILAGAHNFVFARARQSKNEEDYHLWYYAGSNGVICIDPQTGDIKERYLAEANCASENTTAFNGAVRGLDVSKDGKTLLISAVGELGIINLSGPEKKLEKFCGLGVGQLFYSKFIPGTSYALAPAARESQVLVVNVVSCPPILGPETAS